MRLEPDDGYAHAAMALIHTLARHWPEAEGEARAATARKGQLGAGLVDLCLMAATFEQGRPVEGAFDFGSIGLDGAAAIGPALEHLPPIDEGEMRQPAHKNWCLFVAADSGYVRPHLVPLLLSMIEAGIGAGVHVHLYNPAADTMPLIDAVRAKLAPRPLTISRETVDTARYYAKNTYYSSARFCRLFQFVRATNVPTLMVDADSLWRADPSAMLAALHATADIGLCRIDAQPPWARIVGRVVYAVPGTAGADFLRRVALFIADNFRKGTARWFLDQVALHAVHDRASGGTRFAYLPEARMSDRQFTDRSLLWAVTNRMKKDANRYNDLKRDLLLRHGFGGLIA